MTPLVELDELIACTRSIVERIVWATVATVGPNGQPRTRLMHPVWFWSDNPPIAIVAARRTPLKIAHLASQPAVSCNYWDPHHDTVTIDATAEWIPDDHIHEAWDTVKAVDEPVGFDPAIVWPEGPQSPYCGFISLTAHHIIARPVGGPPQRWHTPGT